MNRVVKVRLIENGATVKEIESSLDIWYNVQFVAVGQKNYAYSASLSNPYLIAFYHQTEGRTIKFDSLDAFGAEKEEAA